MSAEAGFEGIYRSSERPKRQEEVLERVQAGLGYKRIAADLDVVRQNNALAVGEASGRMGP